MRELRACLQRAAVDARLYSHLAVEPVGARLTRSDEVAERSDSDHAVAMAALQFTTEWGDLVNSAVRGDVSTIPPMSAEALRRLVPGVVFFAPIDFLQTLPSGADVSETTLRVLLRPTPAGGERPCELTVDISGASRERVAAFEREVLEMLLRPAMRGESAAVDTWNTTLQAVVAALRRGTSLTRAGWFFSTTYLYSEVNVPADVDVAAFLGSLSSEFLATSSRQTSAQRVSRAWTGVGASRAEQLMTLLLRVQPGVQVISVDDLLPREWRCKQDERGVVIAPGAFYHAVKEENVSLQRRRLYVEVTPDRRDGGEPVVLQQLVTPEKFFAAVYRGDETEVRNLLRLGVEVDIREKEREFTAAMVAALLNHAGVLIVALQYGADVNATTRDERMLTPLMFAALGGHESPTRVLLTNGASVNIQNNDGDTALMIASRNGAHSVVALLLESGADIDIQNNRKQTALMLAAFQNRFSGAMYILLRAEPNLELKDEDGLTALDLAKKREHMLLAVMLTDAAEARDVSGEGAVGE